jgi:23S rRNA (adenine2503-C2)-methyltransferase
MAEQGKSNLMDFTIEELQSLALSQGKRGFTGRQLFKWIFKYGVAEFDRMTDLSFAFRKFLLDNFQISKLELADAEFSVDGSTKIAWSTSDKLRIESVVIPDGERLTLCLSSQVGCPVGCGFCATGRMGFFRNLTSGEIFDQYQQISLAQPVGSRVTNLVFMGMGEPLLNLENILKAGSALTSQLGAGLAAGKITVSTIGLVHKIIELADSMPKFKLAVSLHSAIESKRRQLVPVAAGNSLDELKKALLYHAAKSGRRITFEYLLLDSLNDSLADAKALAEYIRGIPCKINLLTYNEVPGLDFRASRTENAEAFKNYLLPRAPAVTVRKSRGADIAAACGQLAGIQKKTNRVR